jgi:hypothetical protein
MKPFIYMGYGVNKLIFGITGTEEPFFDPTVVNESGVFT